MHNNIAFIMQYLIQNCLDIKSKQKHVINNQEKIQPW